MRKIKSEAIFSACYYTGLEKDFWITKGRVSSKLKDQYMLHWQKSCNAVFLASMCSFTELQKQIKTTLFTIQSQLRIKDLLNRIATRIHGQNICCCCLLGMVDSTLIIYCTLHFDYFFILMFAIVFPIWTEHNQSLCVQWRLNGWIKSNIYFWSYSNIILSVFHLKILTNSIAN